MLQENKHLKELISYLPWYEKKSKIYKELFNSISMELEDKDLTLSDLKDQLDLEKATWGLIFWEMPFGILTQNTKDYEYRRALVRAKQQGYGKVDADLLETTIKSFVNGDVKVSFNGKIIFDFNMKNQPMVDLNLIKNAIEEVKPAHLNFILNPSISVESDEPSLEDIEMGYKGKIFSALNLSYGHMVTIYPYALKNTEIENKEYIATANASTTKEITIYHKRSDNN